MKNFSEINFNAKTGIIISTLVIMYSILYLIKNYRAVTAHSKIIICLLITVLLFGIYNVFLQNDKFILLKNNFYLSKGKIVKYFIPNLKGGLTSRGISSSTNYISFVYDVNLIKFNNGYSMNNYVEIPNEKPNLEFEYLVIYEKENPKNSFILLNYPIKDSSALERYKLLFKDKIPDDVFKIK